MRLIFHVVIYITLITYICLAQIIIFGYEEINDKLQTKIDNLIEVCSSESDDQQDNTDLRERYYED